MQCRIYTRVSTDKQERSGLSAEAQEFMCRHECERLGWEVESVVFERESTRKVRPLLGASLEWAQAGKDRAVMVSMQDRICRDLLEFLEIVRDAKRHRFVVHCIDLPFDITTPEGMYAAQMRGANSEFERAMISKRTRGAMAALKARGTTLGRLAHEAPRVLPPATVEYILELRGQTPPLSFRAIARRLRQEGVRGPDGGTFGHSTVAAVVNRHRAKANQAA